MSGNGLYDPDQVAVNTRWIEPWSEAFRAQRDVGLRVPVNFQTVAAVSLTRACFANNQYEHNAFQKCFSNLLAVGFPRFIVDTYWDPQRLVWSLCPVELPRSNGGDSNLGNVPVATGPTVIASSDTVKAQIPQSTLKLPVLAKRQGTSTSATVGSISAASSVVSSTPSSTSSSAAAPTIIDFPTPNGPPILQVGSYNCTSLMTLVLLTGILEDFLETTSTTTGASITMFTFNVHAAASLSDPDAPAPNLSPNLLPESGQLLSDVLQGNLSDKTFTPSLLSDQRANLADSWFDVSWNNLPLDGYYEARNNGQNQQSTTSGWPTEAFMEFQQFYRVVASYGTIDPQMSLYNIGPDLNYMFPPGTIINEAATTLTADGRVTPGCLFAANEDTITPTTNSSFALTPAPLLSIAANPDLTSPLAAITNLTACGISPLLNQTLANTTADKNPLPYAAYVHSTLWTFAPGQPLNASDANPDPNDNRCVVMMKSPYPSRWRVVNCGEAHRVACHDPRKPYNWHISSSATTYANAASFCASPAEFSVPHTPLENAHLFAAFAAEAPPTDNALYINLNSLSVPDCWVVGLNGTCPYLPSTDTNRTRIVVVPTVAAVLIFLLAVLTFFVKCAANRRENRRGRKRRLVDGWEYEGVPS